MGPLGAFGRTGGCIAVFAQITGSYGLPSFDNVLCFSVTFLVLFFMGQMVNKKDLAEVIGYSEKSITEFQKQGLPIVFEGRRGESNQYDTADVVKWLIEKAINKKVISSRERLDDLRGSREELALAKDLEELVPSDEVEEIWLSKVLSARSTLLQRDVVLKSEIDALHNIDFDIELLNEHTRQTLIELSSDESDVEEVVS